MNIKYVDKEARFYFICENCGLPIKDNKGVVDFPMSCSANNKAPLRFYHTGEWPEMLKLMLGIKEQK